MNLKKILATLTASLCVIGSASYNTEKIKISPRLVSAAADEAETIKVWDGTADTSWYDDEETEFHITTAEQLAGLAKLSKDSKKTFEGKTVYLDSNLYMNKVFDVNNSDSNYWKNFRNFSGIGTFDGDFEGNNHYIFNYYADNCIFGDIKGNISNLNAVNLKAPSGICNTSSGKITNCYVSGAVKIAGICGVSTGSVSECVFDGVVKSSGSICGGICLRSQEIRNCFTYGNIISCGAGGISYENKKNINNCASHMQITLNSSTFTNVLYCSGISGGSGEVSDCYNTGSFKGTTKSYEGGICGIAYSNTKVKIKNVYNVGTVTGKHPSALGTHSGTNDIKEFTNSYYLNTTANTAVYGETDPSGVTAKSEANMKKEEFAKALGDAFIYVPGSYPKLACEKENPHLRFDTPSLTFSDYENPAQLTLWEKPENVTWISSNPNVAKVDGNGFVTPVSRGNALIYALYGNSQAVCDVTVTADAPVVTTTTTTTVTTQTTTTTATPVIVTNTTTETPPVTTTTTKPSTELDKVNISVECGEKADLMVMNYSGNITWISSDTVVAKVTKGSGNSAVVEGIEEGTATIYAMLSTGNNLVCQVTVTKKSANNVKYGDANLDGNVSVADAVAIMQFLGNKDKYDLSAEAKANADCYNNGDGITGNDALTIQKIDAKLLAVEDLPVKSK